MPKELRRGQIAGLVLVSAVALFACDGAGNTPDRQIWIGEVEGSDAVIGLAVRGDQVLCYVCGGPETYATHTVWFYAHLEPCGSSGRVEIERDGWRLELELDNDGGWAGGTLRRGEEPPLGWTAFSPADGSRSEIYSARGEDCRHGAIVLHDIETDTSRVQGTWCDGPGVLEQVTPIAPMVEDEGLEIEIAPQGVKSRIVLEPVLE